MKTMFLKNIPQSYEWGGAGIPEYTFIVSYITDKTNTWITVNVDFEKIIFVNKAGVVVDANSLI